MSEKWCPAGKCECEHHGGLNCYAGSERIHVSGISHNFEQCPWPSRQVRLEVKNINVETLPGYDFGYAQAVVDINIVRNHKLPMEPHVYNRLVSAITSATVKWEVPGE